MLHATALRDIEDDLDSSYLKLAAESCINRVKRSQMIRLQLKVGQQNLLTCWTGASALRFSGCEDLIRPGECLGVVQSQHPAHLRGALPNDGRRKSARNLSLGRRSKMLRAIRSGGTEQPVDELEEPRMRAGRREADQENAESVGSGCSRWVQWSTAGCSADAAGICHLAFPR